MLEKIKAFFQMRTQSESGKKQTGKEIDKAKRSSGSQAAPKPPKQKVAAARIGELGEHKIDLQLDQLPKDCMYMSDLLLPNSKSRTGYSQLDHAVVSPYGIFVIETKNYAGEIKGARQDRNWRVSNRYNLYNPLLQNKGHIKALQAHLSEFNGVKYISMISFTMRCRFSLDPDLRKIHSDELVVYDVELSEYIARKLLRLKAELPQRTLSRDEVEAICTKINGLNVDDAKARAEHARLAGGRKKETGGVGYTGDAQS
ncbi:NERD domain-containing protein [Paenibacillus sp. IB182496]|uniref:NERD domain-containing protein n=1 Tax=Paenibacillus sabuli TaxID=2772509 RepID=A0A927BTP5_9BACL|nr:nuclease-related domain-containing protein [Paenibacillus sabuli]MBD2846613.1 NERD domain-containing protein [Paenibacillus sabuli]